MLRALVGLLVASVAVNIYLVATRKSPEAQTTRVETRPAVPRAGVASNPSASSRAADQPAVAPSTSPYASLDRAALEQRLVALEARVAALLPVDERFELAEPSSDSEERVKPFLDKVFKVSAGSAAPPYEVECHGSICKLTVLDKDLSHEDWMQPLQSEHNGMFAGFMFGPNGTFMQLEDPGRAMGQMAAARVFTAVHEGPGIAECKKQHPAPGSATFALAIDPQTHRFVVEASGPLANQALGICVRRVIENAAASVVLDPGASIGSGFRFTVEVP